MAVDVVPRSEKLLVSAKEARQMLGIGDKKFRRWVRAGIIPCFVDPETGWRYYSRERLISTAAELHTGGDAA